MEKPEHVPIGRTVWLQVVAAALVLTALNAPKPVHIDDAVFLPYAVEFAAHPLKPYDFEWGSPKSMPANENLVPPLHPYWIGLGIRLFGNEPFLLKCWLFPFGLILAWGVDFVAARVAPSQRIPLLWLALISPIIAPGFNFMIDVPALALGLAALACTIRSLETSSLPLMLLSGVVAGLTLQTKYTGIGYCAAIFVWCCFERRPVRGAITVALALGLFIGWECFIAYTEEGSHFLINLQQRQGRPLRRVLHLVFPLLSEMAGLAPAVALLAMSALGRRKWAILTTTVAVIVGFGILAAVPSEWGFMHRANGKADITMSKFVYGVLAVPVWGSLCGICLFLIRHGAKDSGAERRLDWFLPLWFLIEMGVYYALSPFSAARRLVGMLVVFTLMAGRVAHLRHLPQRTAWACTAFGIAITLLFCYVDLLDARAARSAAYRTLEVAKPAEGGVLWNFAKYGANYYLDQAGVPPLQLDKQRPRPGDVVAIVETDQEFRDAIAEYPELRIELIEELSIGDDFPLRLAIQYYAGGTPIEHHEGGRVKVRLYLVLAAEFVK